MISLWNTEAAVGSSACILSKDSARQPVYDARLLGDHRRGARHLPVEAHLADDGVAHHTAEPDRTALLVLDGDGDAARSEDLDGVWRLALLEERLADFKLMALQIRRDARHIGGPAELFA